MLLSVVTISVLVCVSLGDHENTTAKARMEEHKVVPDVISVAPPTTVEVGVDSKQRGAGSHARWS